MNRPLFLARDHDCSSLRVALGIAALAAFLLSSLVSCGGGGGSAAPVTQDPPVTVDEKALTPAQPGALLGYFRERLISGSVPANGPPTALPTLDASGAQRYASTTVQESGVDEDDLLKTDGSLIYGLVRQIADDGFTPTWTLRIDRLLADGTLSALSRVEQSARDIRGLYLESTSARVAVLATPQYANILPAAGVAVDALLPYVPLEPPKVSLALYDVARPATPASVGSLSIDGELIASRLVGQRLFLVTRWSPSLPPSVYSTDATVRQAALDRLTARDLLPSVKLDTAAARPLVEETDCLLQGRNASGGTELTTVTVIDLAQGPSSLRSRCFIGGTEAVYLSTQSLYLATTRYTYTQDTRGIFYLPDITTDFHKFTIADGALDYRATGSALGHLGWDPEKKSLRMSEYQGDLRVITYTGQSGWGPVIMPASGIGASPALLTILRENTDDRSLRTLATLPNGRRPAALGLADEQVYAVRFLGPRGYVVTFRRTDPLYLLDLGDPADPKMQGEIKALGFSDYLFPIGERFLLGVGKDASADGRVAGVKVSVFDVGDPASAREVASRVYGVAGSQSALDFTRHGINLMDAGDVTRVALPLRVQSAPEGARGSPGATTQGLLRLAINRATGALVDKPLLHSFVFPLTGDVSRVWNLHELALERSVQIGDQVVYLSAGEPKASAW